MSAHYDVVIVGGGIAGLSLASALAGKCSVALVEAEQTLAYHTSARSARQLIPSYGPPVVQELTVRTLELIAAQDADRPEPVLSPRSFMLIGDDAAVREQASGHMRPITHAEALELCPALVPDSFSAAGLDTGSFACNAPLLLEDHRRRGRSRRRGHHHRRPGPLGPAPRLRLGTRRRAGRLPGRRRGQRRRRLGRRTRRAQRRREARAAAVPAHRGDRRRRASPPGELPHGGGRRRLASTSGATADRSSSRRRNTNRAAPRTRSRTRATSKR